MVCHRIILGICLCISLCTWGSSHSYGSSDRQRHFERSKQLAEGHNFTVGHVKPRVEPVEYIMESIRTMLNTMPEGSKNFDRPAALMSTIVEAFDSLMEETGYDANNDNQNVQWSPEKWSTIVGAVKGNTVIIFEELYTACKKMIPSNRGVGNRVRSTLRIGRDAKRINALNRIVKRMGAVIAKFKKTAFFEDRNIKDGEFRAYAPYYESFEESLKHFIGTYNKEPQYTDLSSKRLKSRPKRSMSAPEAPRERLTGENHDPRKKRPRRFMSAAPEAPRGRLTRENHDPRKKRWTTER